MDEKLSRGAEEVYKNTPIDEIPWNSKQPPELMVELVESGKVKAGRVLDLGCGVGNYAIWLAGKGFDVVGMDASPTAIKMAKRNAQDKGVKCKFIVGDVTGEWPEFEKPFDFVYDWGLLHHIMPENRDKYVENVHGVLKQGSKYLSVCFNARDAAFEGTGKYRQTKLGTAVYLSSEKELHELFGKFFRIIDFRVLEIAPRPRSGQAGKVMTHIFNYCLMERKGS